MQLLSTLPQKSVSGTTLYFYPNLGWVTAERLAQPDVQKAEEIKAFDCSPENSHRCSDCPHNRNCSDWEGKLPCGQQNCWVDVTVASTM